MAQAAELAQDHHLVANCTSGASPHVIQSDMMESSEDMEMLYFLSIKS